ncbi:hypothetical protein D8I24_3643 [Cupriavidus necator H850]|jgi:hypothetical protein|nr:hypothetical protein D8I24_3643 [Cupriavidus necator H850]
MRFVCFESNPACPTAACNTARPFLLVGSASAIRPGYFALAIFWRIRALYCAG